MLAKCRQNAGKVWANWDDENTVNVLPVGANGKSIDKNWQSAGKAQAKCWQSVGKVKVQRGRGARCDNAGKVWAQRGRNADDEHTANVKAKRWQRVGKVSAKCRQSAGAWLTRKTR